MCEGGRIFEKGKIFFLSSYGEIPSRKFFLEKEKIWHHFLRLREVLQKEGKSASRQRVNCRKEEFRGKCIFFAKKSWRLTL